MLTSLNVDSPAVEEVPADAADTAPTLAGETVGVVLVAPGGPRRLREVEAFASALIADSRRSRWRFVPSLLRRVYARSASRLRRRRLVADLRTLGGQTPEATHTADVAAALEHTLNGRTFPTVVWQVTTAFRYGGRTLAEARADLATHGVDRILGVALTPPGLRAVAASLRASWVESGGAAASLVCVPPLADALVGAVRERIHEAVQRFPIQVREGLHVLFAVHPAAAVDADDPAETPVAAVLRLLTDEDLPGPMHVAFGRTWGRQIQRAPGVEDELAALVRAGVRHVLVVPVGYLCDGMDTSFELDVAMRRRGLDLGLLQIEVAGAIGSHRDLVDALAERLIDALPGATPSASVVRHAA